MFAYSEADMSTEEWSEWKTDYRKFRHAVKVRLSYNVI